MTSSSNNTLPGRVTFHKYHGAGNDFILIDLEVQPGFAPSPACAAALCHRNFGVGADGLLLVSRAADDCWRMKIINADGSAAEMCGNGIRCVAAYLREVYEPGKEELLVDSDAGRKRCRFHGAEVEVDMGPAAVIDAAPLEYLIDGRTYDYHRVSVGNPHAVTRAADPMTAARAHGNAMSEDTAHFPARANIEFIHQTAPTVVDAVVYERGCAITMACGTGACAIGAHLTASGDAPPDAWITVNLPGGPLGVKYCSLTGHMHLKGPAVEVFRGELPL